MSYFRVQETQSNKSQKGNEIGQSVNKQFSDGMKKQKKDPSSKTTNEEYIEEGHQVIESENQFEQPQSQKVNVQQPIVNQSATWYVNKVAAHKMVFGKHLQEL